jgi:hypothetical protein
MTWSCRAHSGQPNVRTSTSRTFSCRSTFLSRIRAPQPHFVIVGDGILTTEFSLTASGPGVSSLITGKARGCRVQLLHKVTAMRLYAGTARVE